MVILLAQEQVMSSEGSTNNNRYTFTLDDQTRTYCAETLNETEESRERCLRALKQWCLDNPRLHVKSDDRSLLPFLRGCKFNLERTKKKLQNYYRMRRDVPEWFANRDPRAKEIRELVRLGVFVPLLKPVDRQMVVIVRTAAHDPKRHSQDDVFKVGMMLLDLACQHNESGQIYGIVAIFDMAGVRLAHARQLTPGRIQRAVHAWQNYHCRPKRLDFVQAPTYLNVILKVFKSLMSEKLRKRVHVHPAGLDGLEYIPREVLPKEYGGSDGTLEELLTYWQRKMVDFELWFKADEKFKAETDQ